MHNQGIADKYHEIILNAGMEEEIPPTVFQILNTKKFRTGGPCVYDRKKYPSEVFGCLRRIGCYVARWGEYTCVAVLPPTISV
jgi:hypothetical protein